MAKTLDEAGVKRLIQEIKGANKNLNAPIPISTENIPESMAQNVKNIAAYVEKAKAAGVADVNGMGVTCIINGNYSGVGYIYSFNGSTLRINGIVNFEDIVENPRVFVVDNTGYYQENKIIVGVYDDQITSPMLTRGARNPIILTPSTTEVDEETYQKLLSDNVDVVFMTSTGDANHCTFTYKYDDGDVWSFTFTGFSHEGVSLSETYLYGYEVRITKTGNPHQCEVINNSGEIQFDSILLNEGFIRRTTLSPVLQEIDLRGTEAERKAKLDKFAIDWKALTGASDLTGARFIAKGYFDIPSPPENNVIMTYVENGLVATGYTGIAITTYNSIIGAYRVNIALDGTMSSNAIKDLETTDAFQKFAWGEVPNTYLKIADAASTYETKANVTEILKNYIKDEDAVAIGNIATANAITSIKDDLTPVLKEIDLSGTDAERKAKLDQFETDWKALTGASYLTGARFVGRFGITEDVERNVTGIMTYCAGDAANDTTDNCFYGICNGYSLGKQKSQIAVKVSCTDGSLTITPLFSHLEAITIKTGNTPDDKAANVAAIKAYVDNLIALGVDVTKGFNIPVNFDNNQSGYIAQGVNGNYVGYNTNINLFGGGFVVINSDGTYKALGLLTVGAYNNLTTTSKYIVSAINEVNALAKSKQDALTSGTNIKTVNGQSLLGSGDITISGGGGSAPVLVDIDDITGSAGVSVPVDVFNKIANAASAKTPIFGYSKLVNGPRTTYEIIPLYVKNVSTTADTNDFLSIQFIAENAYNSIGIMKSSDTECSISISSSRPFALDTSVDKSSTRGIQSSAVWNEIHSEPMTVNTATSGVTTLSSTDKHKILCYADSGTQQYNLPSSPVDGETFLFLKVKSGHTITIQSGTGNQNIYDCSSGNSVVSKTIASSTKSKITVTYSSTVDKWFLMADDFIS